MADELRQPLRRRRFGDRLKALRPTPLKAASLVVGLAAILFGAWLALAPYPQGIEPMVRMKVAPATDPIETASSKTEETGEDVAAEDVPAEPEITVVGEEVAALPRPRRDLALAPAPQQAVSEKGPFGLVPRIARDGRTPLDVYGREVDESLLASDRPKVALILGGMGLNAGLTRRATKELPAEVSFAFAPYGKGLQGLIDGARAAGHEVFLQVPMEPFGYPSVNPGERTLLASAEGPANLDNLMWFMGRFSGYVGITNYMGARFAAEENAVRPVLAELKKRGLVFLDDGTLAETLVPRVGQTLGLDMASATRVIDASATFEDVMDNLRRLEEEARSGSIALATGTGLAVTIEAIAAWARDLGPRGAVLVPASSVFRARRG
jgi:hypothetical protein